MKRILAILLCCGFSTAALAQGRPPESPGFEAVTLAYRQMALAIDQLRKEHLAEIQALRQNAANMDAYLRACGDNKGCTVPTGEK